MELREGIKKWKKRTLPKRDEQRITVAIGGWIDDTGRGPSRDASGKFMPRYSSRGCMRKIGAQEANVSAKVGDIDWLVDWLIWKI